MPEIVLYAKPADPYSVRLRELLRRKGVAFSERDAAEADAAWELPQLVVDGVPLGTYEDVGSLDLRGKLDALLR